MSLSLQYFFREGGYDNGGGIPTHRVVLAAVHAVMLDCVHAVMLECGFVGFDTVSGERVDGCDLPVSLMSICYTLPELLNQDVTEFVVLKCQSLGTFVNVYGCVAHVDSDSVVRRLCLNGSEFVAPVVHWKDDHGVFDEMRHRVMVGLALPLKADVYRWHCEQSRKRKRAITEIRNVPLKDPQWFYHYDDSSEDDIFSSDDCDSGCNSADPLAYEPPFVTYI
ncbi:F-box protein SKIP22-like [Melia azedarach]|uniref:F-box protein SKIP22-like n=1 Tax=Melia azedarach TaxID=155640 RepID=A0ACC1Z110_MELAZ|nr:F-box protein SKIP22-like [Melia azedarach]